MEEVEWDYLPDSWDDDTKYFFEVLYKRIKWDLKQELFLHPKTIGKINDEEFDTIAWNAAWMAADIDHHGF